jgi:excisionase family DNA binding protein
MCMAPKLLTTPEAAKAIGVTRETIRNWIKQGRVKPPNLKIGGLRLWSEVDVARLRKAQKAIKIGRPVKSKG